MKKRDSANPKWRASLRVASSLMEDKRIEERIFPGGVVCSGCGAALREGDHYRDRPEGMMENGAVLLTIVCINCADR